MDGKPASAPTALSEFDARDRIEQLLCYLRTLLSNASDDLETATGTAPLDSTLRLAAEDAATSLAMAKEYLAEISRLEERPAAREQRGTATV